MSGSTVLYPLSPGISGLTSRGFTMRFLPLSSSAAFTRSVVSSMLDSLAKILLKHVSL